MLDAGGRRGAGRAGRRAGGGARGLRALPPALARLVLRALAEEAVGGDALPVSRARSTRVLALGRAAAAPPSLDLGGGLRAVAEYGTLRFRRGGEAPPPEPVALPRARASPASARGRSRPAAGAGEVTVVAARAWTAR